MKFKLKSLSLIIFMFVCFFALGKVYAATYDINVIPINITTASSDPDLVGSGVDCNIDSDAGRTNCYYAYLYGMLNNYIIDNGVVEPGEKIMNIIEVVPGDGSVLSGIKLTFKNDVSASTQGGVSMLPGATAAQMGYVPGTSKTVFGNTTWSSDWSMSATSGDGLYTLIADSGNAKLPLTNTAPLWATFYTIKDGVAPGQDIVFSFDTSRLALTNGTDASSNLLALSPHDLTLSVLSTVSVDGTLKTLTATGNNNLGYPFGFVPSSKTDLTYSFVVPNSVTSVTFTGEATDSNAKGVTGLDTANSLNVGDNEITITVTAESGDKTNYKITVHRLSNDTTLKSISATNSVNLGTITSINANFGSSITIPYKTTNSTVSAQTTHSSASISGEGMWNFTTDNTTNVTTTKVLTVQAEDCLYTADDVPGNVCTSQDYTFNVTRTAPSKNVDLSTITIDGNPIAGFSKTKYEYTLDDAPASKSSIVIGASLDDTLNTLTSIKGPKANTTGSENYTISGTNNSYTATGNVNVGDNTYEIKVTSEDGTTTATYTISLHRKSNDTLLYSLSVTSNPNGTLSPDFSSNFDSSTGEYTYTYDPNVTQINFDASARDTGKAYVSIIDMSTSEAVNNSVKTLNRATQSFNISTTKVGVIVTAEDGSTRVYKFKLSRQLATNNYLSSLSINPGTINETFSSTRGSYTATVGPDVTSTEVSYTLADPNASVTAITGNTNFSFGSGNIITVSVTSESGAVNNYTINVTRQMYDIAFLSDLRVGIGTASATTVSGFNKNTFEYTISTEENPIPYDTTTLNIEYAKENQYSSVSGDVGVRNLSTGDNTFTVTVVSQDGTVTNNYIIHAYRQKNTDNETKGVVVAGVTATKSTTEENTYEVTLPNSQATLAPSEVEITVDSDANLTKPTTTMNLSTTEINEYNYTVTSDSGEAKNYVIKITRTKSNNANITRVNLYLSGEATSSRYCVMSNTDNGCTIEVPTGTSGYRLEAIIDSAAQVSPANTTEYTMTTAASDSTQVRQLTVTAEDNTTKDYNITVQRAKSANANLKSITVTDITDPDHPQTQSLIHCVDNGEWRQTCNLTVDSSVAVVKVEAETEDDAAIILSGLHDTLNLPFNIVRNEIKVQAENPSVAKTYTLNITRSFGEDATLSDLKVENTTVSGFDPDDTEYTIANVDYDTVTLVVEGITTDSNANITSITNNGRNIPVTASHDVAASVPLSTGLNTISMVVTAHDGDATETYVIKVNRALNDSTAINGITVAGISATVNPSDSSKYTVTVPNNVTEANSTNVVVNVADGKLSTDPKATYTVPTLTLETLDSSSNPVANELVIPVTAEDGTIKNYTVTITRTPSDVTILDRVNLFVGSETTTTRYCVLDSSDVGCTIAVNETTSGFRLVGIPHDDKANVTFRTATETGPTFTMSASESTKQITARVTAENGIDYKDYTVTVERAQSGNNYLSDIKTNAHGTEISDDMETIVGFSTTKFGYDLVVPGAQSKIHVHAEVEDEKSKITSDYTTTNSTTIDFEYDLGNPGTTSTIDMIVTAENGNKATYTLRVLRQQNIEPRLSMIYINGNSINSYLEDGVTFDPDVTEYTVYDFSNTKSYSGVTPHHFTYSSDAINLTADNVDSSYGTVNGSGSKNLHTIYYDGHTADNHYINDVTITGVAQNTSVYKEYLIHVKRDASSDTGVMKVEMEYDGSLHTATFANGVYNITVPNSVNKANSSNVVVTPVDPQVPNVDAKATVTMGETDLVTNNPSTGNLNTHRFTVVAEDGTEREYRLLITREKSDVSTLDDIKIQDGEGNEIGLWNRSFRSGTLSYTVTVPEDTSTFVVIPTKSEENETISGLSNNGTYTLSESQRVIRITSTSESGEFSTTYEVTIKRQANNNNNLGSLVVEDESGNEYAVGITEEANKFTVNVPGNIDKVIITAYPESLTSTVRYVAPDSGTTNTYTIPVGTTQKEVQIISESGGSQSYYIEITRDKKSDATLSSLTYMYTNDGIVHVLDLTTGDKDFILDNVPYSTSQVYIAASASDAPVAVVSGQIGQQSIAPGPNKFIITVTAEDGTTTQEYSLTVEREKNNDATLKILNISGETLNETFNKQTIYYTMNVDATKRQLVQSEITAVPTDPNATVTLDPDLTLSTENPNIYRITVTAADGLNQMVYQITITRPKSSDATLKAVNLTGATISPSVSPTNKSYTITVPYGSTGFEIEGIPNSDTAEVYGNGVKNQTSGTITLTVSAEDGTINTYSFTIVEALSNDATLTNLEVAGYPFVNPTTFISTTLQYAIGDVENSTEALVLRATPSNANSTIKYYDESGNLVSCTEATGETPTDRACTIPLKTGTGTDRTLTAEVTAPDGTTKRQYSVKFNKVNSSNAYLANIIADQGTFDKTFNKATETYTLKVGYAIETVNLEFIAEQPSATIKINNDTAAFTPRVYTVDNLVEGESRQLSVLVIAEDGSSRKTYTVNVERATYTGSSDSTLASLSVDYKNTDETLKNYPLSPAFSSNETTYSIGEIPYTLAELQITANPNIAQSQVEYYVNGTKQFDNNVLIPKASGTITVKVTSENGTSISNYVISYTKHANDDATLKSLATTPSDLDNAFNPDLHNYNLNIDYNRRSADIVMETNDPNATIKVNGVPYINNSVYTLNNLPVGTTTATIIVTAEDGITQVTYKVNVTREGIGETITSVEFGHDISDGYIKTVSNRTPSDDVMTVLDMKNQLDNENSKLEIWNSSDDTKLSDTDTIGTGMIVKLIIDGNITDSKIIVIKGDVNGDGEINVIDASGIVNHFLNRIPLLGAYLVAADTNIDTDANVIDASQVVNHFLGRQSIVFKQP